MGKCYVLVHKQELIGVYSNKTNLWKQLLELEENFETDFFFKKNYQDLVGVTYPKLNKFLNERINLIAYNIDEKIEYRMWLTEMNNKIVFNDDNS